MAFTRQLELGKQYKAGTFDSNISFIQGLTEALKAVPNAILLASLPESELEVGGTMGQRALESLETYFARVESVWKPVGSREAFEIVRRRLFESSGERAEVEGISRQFSDFYRQHADKFPWRPNPTNTLSDYALPTRFTLRYSIDFTKTGPLWTNSSEPVVCFSTWPL